MTVNIQKTTELYTVVVNYMVCELYLSKLSELNCTHTAFSHNLMNYSSK